MPLLGLLWGASGLTSVGRYLIIGVAGLFAAGILVNGIVAPYKREIANLKSYQKELELAAEKRQKMLDEDQALAETQANHRAALEAEIEKVLHAPANRSDACRLTSDQLFKLRSYLTSSR